MLAPYRDLYRLPGVRPFVLGALASRVGGAMFGVAVIVMVSSRRGSYGLAGAVSAVGLLVLAAAGPFLGRLVDRHGQRRVAVPFVVSSTVAGLVLAVCSAGGAPAWTLFVAYAVSAVIPEMGSLTRARWAHLLGEDAARLHTALSFEQVADEFGYVVGPVLAVLLSTLVTPEAGLVGAYAMYAIGGLTVLANQVTEPPVVPHEDRPVGIALRRPGLALLAAALMMTGILFGGNEVAAVAIADAAGEKSVSSIVLALFALGSMIAGTAYGTMHFTSTLTSRLVVTSTAMFLLEVPALVTGQWLPVLAGAMFVAGSATAPMLITAMSLTQRILPAAFMTEGLAVVVTGILVGISGGTAVGGWAVEHLGPRQAYAVPVIAGGLAVVLVLLGARVLRAAEAVAQD